MARFRICCFIKYWGWALVENEDQKDRAGWPCKHYALRFNSSDDSCGQMSTSGSKTSDDRLCGSAIRFLPSPLLHSYVDLGASQWSWSLNEILSFPRQGLMWTNLRCKVCSRFFFLLLRLWILGFAGLLQFLRFCHYWDWLSAVAAWVWLELIQLTFWNCMYPETEYVLK